MSPRTACQRAVTRREQPANGYVPRRQSEEREPYSAADAIGGMLMWPESTVYEGLASVETDEPSRPAPIFEGERATYSDLLAESRIGSV